MKNAVMIVPIPTIVGISFIFPPPRRKTALPRITQIKSVQMRTYLNFPSFHFEENTIATAS